jgi:hypothetical protein
MTGEVGWVSGRSRPSGATGSGRVSLWDWLASASTWVDLVGPGRRQTMELLGIPVGNVNVGEVY